MTIEPRPPSEVPAKMGGAALAALIGWMLGGPMGGVAGVVLTPLMEAWAAKVQQEFQRRGQEVAGGAADASHLDEDEVVERILTSHHLQPLVMRVLDAAARTDSTPKLRALGAVLGEAVTIRPRQVDEDLFIVAALDDLEPAHLRVLEALEGSAIALVPTAVGWTSTTLVPALPDLTAIGLHAALGGLVRHGLVDTQYIGDTMGEIGYEITEFGHAMLEVMRISPECPPGEDSLRD